jgi:hypothetical protein
MTVQSVAVRVRTVTAAIVLLAISFPAARGEGVAAGISDKYEAREPGKASQRIWKNLEGRKYLTLGMKDSDSGGSDTKPVFNPSVDSHYPGITGAYVFDGIDDGAWRASVPVAAASSFEIWVKPKSLSEGNQVIWEQGGGPRGGSLILMDTGALQFSVCNRFDKDASNGQGQPEAVVLSYTMTKNDLSDFMQVVGVADGTAGESRLYINGLRVAAVSRAPKAWSGTGVFGVGCMQDAPIGALPGFEILEATKRLPRRKREIEYTSYNGMIAVLIIYAQKALSDAEVLQNYQVIAGSANQ